MHAQAQNAEEQLVALLEQIASRKVGWQCAHLHLSRLSPINRQEYSLRIAVNVIDELVANYERRIFLLENHDLILVVCGAQVNDVKEAVLRVRHLFQDDPLVAKRDGFSSWYDLSVDHDRCLADARTLLHEKHRRHNEATAPKSRFGAIEPLDPNRLSLMQGALATLDISAYMRRQPVCALIEDQAPAPVFEECYVRIADLQRPLMPNVNLYGNRWLFQHLTQSLDLRVLALFSRNPGQHLATPTSINLNVDTLLSQSFLDFDKALKPGAQPAIVLELQLFDIFADLAAFHFGRDFARSKGYRLCLDGLTSLSFGLVDRKHLAFDLVKVHWDKGLPQLARKDGEFADAVKAAGGGRVILSRCDDQAAIDFGRSVGISLFQGRYVDFLVNPGARSRN